MKTLIERARESTDRIKALGDSQASQAEAALYSTRIQELSSAVTATSVPARMMELFAAKGIEVEMPSAQLLGLKQTIDDLAVKFESDPRSLLGPNPIWRLGTKNQLAALPERVNAHLLAAWRNHVSRLRPKIDQGILRVLQSHPTHRAQAGRIAELLTALTALAERLPMTPQELDGPTQLASEAQAAWQNLPQDFPGPVRDLFFAINAGTATAEHLTDETLAWLRGNDLLSSLRVAWNVSD